MTSEIDIKMSVCDRKVHVAVSDNKDGTLAVDIKSDCPALENYSRDLKLITMDDIMCFEKSKINNENVRGNMSMICLTPIAVYQAAWMELGMMSKNIYKSVGPIMMMQSNVDCSGLMDCDKKKQ